LNIFKATADFEHWLAGQLPIIRRISRSSISTWRGRISFFPRHLLSLAAALAGALRRSGEAPAVLGVGDLHIENFGRGGMKKDASSGA